MIFGDHVRPGIDRLLRVRSVDGFPSGRAVLEHLKMCVESIRRDDGVDGAVAYMLDRSIADWIGLGLPAWWVREDTAADLCDTELPETTPANVDWPFPTFLVVCKNALCLVGSDIPMACGERVFYVVGSVAEGPQHHRRVVASTIRMDDPLTMLGRFEGTPDPGKANRIRGVCLSVGAALYLSTRDPETVRSEFLTRAAGTRGSSPIERLRAKLPIDPTWLEDAVPDLRRTYGTRGGTHATPSTHWRRAHWRQQRVGAGRKDSRMVWVRHALVAPEAEHVA